MTSPLIRRHSLAAGAALGLALVLTGCGTNEAPGASATVGSEATVKGIATAHNDTDVAFIQDMTPHHEGAVEMSALAATRAESPQVKALAAAIQAAQEPEIQLMKDMAEAWKVDLADDGGHGGMNMGGGGDVPALEPLSGAAFDKEFLVRMTAHHEGALVMAKVELDKGENPQAQELARAIIATQETEIATMRALLAGL